jgi:hypothetical protein
MAVWRSDSVFELPGGLVTGDGRSLYEAELRPITGREEEWLAEHAEAPSAVAVTRVLSSCLARVGDMHVTPELARSLLAGDRDYLMLQLRRLTLGERVQAVLACPSCGGNVDVEFRVADVPVETRRQEAAAHAFMLQDGRRVRFRLPTGADQEAVLGLEIGEAAEALFARCLIHDGGTPATDAERAAIIEAMDRVAPQVDLELEVRCLECSYEFLSPFDTTSFFFQEMRLKRGQLMREVHWLAFYYHWSEGEILGLSRLRRRVYLDLLSDALREE